MTPYLLLLATLTVLSGVSVWASDASSERSCDAARLSVLLAGALPGESVRIGACTVEGSFRVPAGVTLRGTSPRRSIIVAPPDKTAVELLPGIDAVTTLRQLSIRSAGSFGVRSDGEGAIWIDRVTIESERGVGIGIEDVSEVSISATRLSGSVDVADSATTPVTAPAGAFATHGIVLLRVDEANLFDVTAQGYAGFGLLGVESNSAMIGVNASRNVGVGVGVHAGTATLDNVSVRRTLAGSRSAGDFSAGVAIAGGAIVSTRALDTLRGDGYGVFQHDADVRHEGLRARGNAHAGLWTQASSRFELDRSTVDHNAYSNVSVLDSERALITRSTLKHAWFGTAGGTRAADGIQLVRTPGELFRVSLFGNARAGFVGQLGAGVGAEDVGFRAVQVQAPGRGEVLGVVLQRNDDVLTPPPGILRRGSLPRDDARLAASGEPLPVTGTVAPRFLAQMDALRFGASLQSLFEPVTDEPSRAAGYLDPGTIELAADD